MFKFILMAISAIVFYFIVRKIVCFIKELLQPDIQFRIIRDGYNVYTAEYKTKGNSWKPADICPSTDLQTVTDAVARIRSSMQVANENVKRKNNKEVIATFK